MYNFITIYEIPSSYKWVERWNPFKTWNQLTHVKYNVPCVIIFNDDFKGYSFIVCYKGQMQTTGGSGSCYNPAYSNQGFRPKQDDPSMSKPVLYNSNLIWQRICSLKYSLLETMGYRDSLPFWYWNCEDYINHMYGLLAGKLDLIGMGKADTSIIHEGHRHQPKLLSWS